MPRQVTIPERIAVEDIGNISHYPGTSVSFSVGKGKANKKAFIFDVPQTFEQYNIAEDLYDDLITRYTEKFSAEDLWYYVDLLRSGAANTAPSPNYDWNTTAQVWVPNISKAKAKKLQEVEQNRIALADAPILYQNVSIDANAVSRDNILGKYLEIQTAIALGLTPSPLIWKDSTNTFLSWADVPSYKLWLEGLVMAIANRNTRLYQRSWSAKETLLNLTEFTSIEAFDTTLIV